MQKYVFGKSNRSMGHTTFVTIKQNILEVNQGLTASHWPLVYKKHFKSIKHDQRGILFFVKLQSSLTVQSELVGLGVDFVFPPSQQSK